VGGRARVDKKGRRHRLAGGGPGSSDVASVKAPPQVGVLLGGRLRRPFLFSAFVTTLHVADLSTPTKPSWPMNDILQCLFLLRENFIQSKYSGMRFKRESDFGSMRL